MSIETFPGIDITGMHHELLRHSYCLSVGQFAGKTVLDVGAGISDFTAALHAEGANPFAIDPGYADIEAFTLRGKIIDADNQEQMGRIFGFRGVDSFVHHRTEHPNRYIAASALELPFADESMDAVFNCRLIATTAIKQPEETQKAIIEMYRVLKVGGKLMTAGVINPAFLRKEGAIDGANHMREVDRVLMSMFKSVAGKKDKIVRQSPQGELSYAITKNR